MNILLFNEDTKDYLKDIDINEKNIYVYNFSGRGYNKQVNEIDKILSDINRYSIDILLCSKDFVTIASRALWMSDLKAYVLTDSEEAMVVEVSNANLQAKMWNMVASTKNDDPIGQAGFVSSVTGESFTKEEVEEFQDNVEAKLSAYIKQSSNIMDIGVASGLTCMHLAPKCNEYTGIDISSIILKRTAERLKKCGINNVSLFEADAYDIDKLNIPQQDIILINSVIQYFPGYNYFILTMKKLLSCMQDTGVIYIGDVLDLAKMDAQKKELKLLGMKENNRKDLYYPRELFYELQAYIPEISTVEITEKIGMIENEFKKYRYDVMLHIDKHKQVHGKKTKFLYAMQSKDFSWEKLTCIKES